MSILKLQVGEPITMTVKAIRSVEGQFGPQLAFDDEAGDTLFLGEDTAQRQLDRIGMGRDGAIGTALLFEKVQKGTKTFVNINPAPRTNGNGSGAKGATGGAAIPRQAGTTQPPAPTPSRPSRQAVEQALDAEAVGFSDPLYLAITRFVLNEIKPVWESKIHPAPEALAACVNTLYIQASRNGR